MRIRIQPGQNSNCLLKEKTFKTVFEQKTMMYGTGTLYFVIKNLGLYPDPDWIPVQQQAESGFSKVPTWIRIQCIRNTESDKGK